MALVRAVTFEGVSPDGINQVRSQVQDEEPPQGLNPKEIVMLHNSESQDALVLIFFETEDDYRRGDEVLNAMPSDETPGRRTSVKKYEVVMRRAM